jgi:hypothetical protein
LLKNPPLFTPPHSDTCQGHTVFIANVRAASLRLRFLLLSCLDIQGSASGAGGRMVHNNLSLPLLLRQCQALPAVLDFVRRE